MSALGCPDPGHGPAGAARVALTERIEEAGFGWPVLVWRPGPGWRMISSGVVGGGIGPRNWWLNAAVGLTYARLDPAAHLAGIAGRLGLTGPGVGMLTAADVTRWRCGHDGGVDVTATVGLGVPVPAAAPAERIRAEAAAPVGTINLLVVVPVPLSDAALVNAVGTATEAKTQALLEAGVPGTGTASDAVCIACPEPEPRPDPGPSPGRGTGPEPFGGPRSPWGSRLARAVHAAVAAGTADWLGRHPNGDPHRRWPDGSATPGTVGPRA